jgi:hypothetical protein
MPQQARNTGPDKHARSVSLITFHSELFCDSFGSKLLVNLMLQATAQGDVRGKILTRACGNEL